MIRTKCTFSKSALDEASMELNFSCKENRCTKNNECTNSAKASGEGAGEMLGICPLFDIHILGNLTEGLGFRTTLT